MKIIFVVLSFVLSLSIFADTVVYGRAHLVFENTDNLALKMKSNDSLIGLKGINLLADGLQATHQLEFNYDFTNKEQSLLVRRNWLGIKGSFGQFRVGLQESPYYAVNDAAKFLLYGEGHGLHAKSNPKNILAYLKKIGSFGLSTSYAVSEVGSSESDFLFSYNTYPLSAGFVYKNIESGVDGIKLAVATRGLNYAISLVSERQPLTGNIINTLSAKYIEGNFWLAGQYSKNSTSDVAQKNIEVGFKLGKKTKTYYEWGAVKGMKSNRLGLVHDF